MSKPIHFEAQMALTTRRAMPLTALQGRLKAEGRLTEDVVLLCNALETAIEEAHEADRRMAEGDRVLIEQARTLEGMAAQTERILRVLREGGTYKSHAEREANGFKEE